jgi:CheY-like chemotaxis protein
VEFQQLDPGMAKRHAGTGLGLALTKRIVEAQGGRVAVRSAPGQGSTFSAFLPRTLNVETEVLPSSGLPAILVIEDDVEDRKWITRTLETAGYTVEAVATGTEAVERCRHAAFAGVTLDLLLPDGHGWKVLHEIHDTDLNRHVPVVVVTVTEDRRAGAGFPVHDYLVKPLDRDLLLQSLNSALGASQRTGPVLVVDDDPGCLKLAEQVLQEMGCRSICETSSEQALQAARLNPPSVIVLDLLMPGMNGFEFLNELRQTPAGRQVPVIVWTVKDLTSGERAQLRASAQAVVLKSPDGAARLLDELRSFITPTATHRPDVGKGVS